MRIVQLVAFTLGTAFVAVQPLAGEFPESLQRCAQVDDDAQRLACYDREAARSRAAEPAVEGPPPATQKVPERPANAAPESAAAPAPEPAAEPGGDTADAVASFGLPERDEDKDEPDEISAKVAKIDVRANGERIFTLDNGQVWVEKSPARSPRLKEGDPVRIKAGLFGSYRLFGSGNRSTGVDRVR